MFNHDISVQNGSDEEKEPKPDANGVDADSMDDYFDEPDYYYGEDTDDEIVPEAELQFLIEKYLSSADIEILNTGLETLKHEFEQKLNLPKAIVFLETSARPLYYVLAPLLRDLYQKKGQPFPQIHFLTPHKGSGRLHGYLDEIQRLEKDKLNPLQSSFAEYARDDLSRQGIPLSDSTVATTTRNDLDEAIEEEKMYIKLLGYDPEELVGNENLTEIMEQNLVLQLQKIKTKIASSEGLDLFFIDDYLNSGDTIDALRIGLFQSNLSFASLFIFAADSEKPVRDSDGEPLYGMNIIVGKFMDATDYSGFRFRAGGGFNPYKTYLAKQEQFSTFGTTKTLAGTSTNVVPNTTGAKRSELRTVLKKIGEDFIKKQRVS